VLDLDLLLTPQVNIAGGRNVSGNLWGNVDYTLNIDTQKAGLWAGGFLKFEADTGFGSNIFHDVGAIVPVNTAALLPGIDDRTTALMNASLMQFLSPQFGLVIGKINTVDLGVTEFYGDYRTQFMNAAFNFPMTLEQVPLSTFGGGVIGIPREDILLSALVLGPNGTPTSDSVSQAFDGSALVLGSAQFTVKPFGLVGHQSISFTWNDKERFSLTQDPTNLAVLLLQDRFPRLANPGPVLEGVLAQTFPALLVPARPANRTSGSWALSYAFDQYFWQPDNDPKHGIGLFFAFGASDGNPNPIKYAFLTGVGGKGVAPGRPDDSFGIGIARTQFSSDFVPFLRQQLNLGLQHEDAIEMYYNISVTQWLNVTADVQIINPGLKKALNEFGQLANVDTAAVAGARLRVRF
ncbi:MAG: carbohydrate porin, partial [Acidobacteriaceae bacterium]|nr:carbohydrate porin [Acidobacteriaceae bacterium]